MTTEAKLRETLTDTIVWLEAEVDHPRPDPHPAMRRLASDLRAALQAAPVSIDRDGTETECPLVGVHEHAFRGPHRFREWGPADRLSHEYIVTRHDKVGCDWNRPDGRLCNLARIDPLHRADGLTIDSETRNLRLQEARR